jgi:hypothetical protein
MDSVDSGERRKYIFVSRINDPLSVGGGFLNVKEHRINAGINDRA